MARIALTAILGLLVGCEAKFGPGEYGWLYYSFCTYEGGVAFEVEALNSSVRLGCTDPMVGPLTPEQQRALEEFIAAMVAEGE